MTQLINNMETLQNCPVCGNDSFHPFISLSDYFLTREDFKIVECNKCSFRFTNPRPVSSELGKYYESNDYISHSNTRKGLFSILYQGIRKYTIRSKFKMISGLANGNSLLDIGCATGELLHYFRKKKWDVTGIEPNDNARKFAHEEYDLRVEDENYLKQIEIASIDVITMWHVLEHVSDLNGRLGEINRILKEDGVLIIAVPNSGSPDAKHYGKFWAGYDVPRHLYHFSKPSMHDLLRKHGFDCIKEFPMKFDAFYVSLLSERYIHGKNRWIAALFSGLRSNVKARRGKNYSSMIFVAKKSKI